MTTDNNRPGWAGRAKWLVAFVVFGAVMAAGCHNQCRPIVAACVAEGMALGVLFGLAVAVSRRARTISLRRTWVVVRKETHAATVIGLLGGLVKAVLQLLGG